MNKQTDLFTTILGERADPAGIPSNFYNTIGLTGTDLKKAKSTSASQSSRILQFFRSNPNSKFTTVQVSDRLGFNLNSVRRCCTDLSQEEQPEIEMLEEKVMERFGQKNHYYCLKKKK